MAAGASGIRAGRAFVELGADNDPLSKALKQAEARLKSFGKSVGAIGAAISGLGAAIYAPFLGAAKKFADAGSALNDMSARTGVSVEGLSALGHAAGQTGTDMDTVEGAIRKMQKALVKGSEENVQAEATFAALGVSVDRLIGLAPEEQFNILAKEIAAIPNPTAKAAAAMEVFGKSGTALLPMIDDLDALTQEAKDFGLVWTGDEAKKADALGDALDLLKEVLARVVSSIGSELAPLLTDVAVAMARTAKVAIDWVKANGPLIVAAFELGVALSAAGVAITGLGIAIYGTGAAFGVLATVVGLILNPITGTILAVGGLAAAFVLLTDTGGKALSWLGDRFHELVADAQAAFGGIADAMRAGDIGLAAQILWAAVKVEWLKGTNFLGGVTRDGLDRVYAGFDRFRYGLAGLIVDLMDGARAAFVAGWYAIGGIFESAWAAIKTGFYAFTNGFMDYFDGFSSGIVGAIITMVGEIRKEMAIAKGFLTLSDSSKAVGEINKETEARQAAFDADQARRKKARDDAAAALPAEAAKMQQDIEAKKQERLAGIGQGNLDAHAALNDQQAAAADARKKANEDAAGAGEAALRDAQDNLAGLIEKAKAGVPGGIVDAKKGGPEGEGRLTPEALDKSLQETKAKVSTAGTFSASAAAGLGVGQDIQGKQLDEQKKANGHLEQISKKVGEKQLAFA